MEENQQPSQEPAHTEAKPALTPHELYNHHILHPNEPITDDDIRNLKIDSGAVYKEHQLTKDEARAGEVDKDESSDRKQAQQGSTDLTEERPKESPYDILGGS